MNLKFTVMTLATALSGSVYAQQIVEQTYPLVPVSPTDQQIMAVQQAERQIQANEQAIALEKPELLKDKPRQTQPQLQNAEPPKPRLMRKKPPKPLKRKPTTTK